MGLLLVHVHERRVVVFERRDETIQVALLHDRTYAVIFLEGVAGEIEFSRLHALRLHFDAKAPGKRNVNAILERHLAPRNGHVARHRARGIELACAPLYLHAVARVGVVGSPELVAVLERAVLHVSAAGRARLHVEVWVFRPLAREDVVVAHCVVKVHVALMRGVKICRADVVDVRVRIPLYKGKVWD